MHQLTDVGIEAMAEELHRIASDGGRSWDRTPPELQAEFRNYIWQLIDKAREAEAERDTNEQGEHDG
jgi:acyl-CoA reductase-like NAD-dependent aldehyde dehydrogenase